MPLNLKKEADLLEQVLSIAETDYAQAYLGEGWFAVLFPGEAHRPMTAPDGIPVHVKKAVAKIKIN